MLFNSFGFLLFFPSVAVGYFLLPQGLRNLFLLLASYFFYWNWEPVYVVLLLSSTLATYTAGSLLSKCRTASGRRFFLVFGITINLVILAFFKYANFVAGEFEKIFSGISLCFSVPQFDYLLPVGISFYTFQAIGYTIDVFKGRVEPENSFLRYALFVSFFPQLVAGPIERASNLLPQFSEEKKLTYSNFCHGIRLIILGYFMKVFIGDRLAIYVDFVFENPNHHFGSTIVIASVFFAFQIYCDFAGYSNIAIGTARILGFRLMDNFRRPYLSRNLSEFWSRWHISLSGWLRDYIYIPLGGSRCSGRRYSINVLLTFLISGIWHGANWTFMLWGVVHGGYLLLEKYFSSKRGALFNLGGAYGQRLLTLSVITLSWIIFRANNFDDLITLLKNLTQFQRSFSYNNIESIVMGGVGIVLLLVYEFKQERHESKMPFLESENVFVRWVAMLVMIFSILLYGVFDGGQFIYFQF